MLYDTKVKGLDLKFDAGRNSAAVILEVNHRNENKRLQIFEYLEKYKVILEEGFKDGLIWDFCYIRENGEEVCRIFCEQDGYDVHRQNQWPDIYNFFIANMLLLETNFLVIRDLIKEELNL